MILKQYHEKIKIICNSKDGTKCTNKYCLKKNKLCCLGNCPFVYVLANIYKDDNQDIYLFFLNAEIDNPDYK